VKADLRVEDIMEIVSVPRSWVYEHTRRGSADPIPCYRFGKHLRFNQGEIEDWIKRHRRGEE